MQFDPETATNLFAQMDDDELIRIAFLEDTYLEEAKDLAKKELAERGLGEISQSTIEKVRSSMSTQRHAEMDVELEGFEPEEGIPSWRRAIQVWLAPYRTALIVLTLVIMATFGLNWAFEWGLLGIGRRKSLALSIAIGLFSYLFIFPTREEAKDKLYTRDGRRK